ncbi:hypothetical protein BDV19DRAFT_361493 [Aspergillus venezuelensis]
MVTPTLLVEDFDGVSHPYRMAKLGLLCFLSVWEYRNTALRAYRMLSIRSMAFSVLQDKSPSFFPCWILFLLFVYIGVATLVSRKFCWS